MLFIGWLYAELELSSVSESHIRFERERELGQKGRKMQIYEKERPNFRIIWLLFLVNDTLENLLIYVVKM